MTPMPIANVASPMAMPSVSLFIKHSSHPKHCGARYSIDGLNVRRPRAFHWLTRSANCGRALAIPKVFSLQSLHGFAMHMKGMPGRLNLAEKLLMDYIPGT